MADYRIVLAQLPTRRAAQQAARILASAFARHLDAVKAASRYRGELTEPLYKLARDEGFEWAAEDRFTWDDRDDDPSFAGALLDRADFTKTDASHASFAHGSALGAVFTGATLDGADFTGARR